MKVRSFTIVQHSSVVLTRPHLQRAIRLVAVIRNERQPEDSANCSDDAVHCHIISIVEARRVVESIDVINIEANERRGGLRKIGTRITKETIGILLVFKSLSACVQDARV